MGEKFLDEIESRGRAHPAQFQHDEIRRDRTQQAPPRTADGRWRFSAALEWDSAESLKRRLESRARGWLRTKANSIEGGTSEVMLNVDRQTHPRSAGSLTFKPLPLVGGVGVGLHLHHLEARVGQVVPMPTPGHDWEGLKEDKCGSTMADDQAMLLDTVKQFLAETAPVKHLRDMRVAKDATGFGHALWKPVRRNGLYRDHWFRKRDGGLGHGPCRSRASCSRKSAAT